MGATNRCTHKHALEKAWLHCFAERHCPKRIYNKDDVKKQSKPLVSRRKVGKCYLNFHLIWCGDNESFAGSNISIYHGLYQGRLFKTRHPRTRPSQRHERLNQTHTQIRRLWLWRISWREGVYCSLWSFPSSSKIVTVLARSYVKPTLFIRVITGVCYSVTTWRYFLCQQASRNKPPPLPQHTQGNP